MRYALAALLDLAAFALIWAGVDLAPARGWPVTGSEMNGCCALVLGMMVKTAGHCLLMFGGR